MFHLPAPIAQSRVSSLSVSLHRSVTSFKFHCVEFRTFSSRKVIPTVVSFTASDFSGARLCQCFAAESVSQTANLVSLPSFAFGIQASEFDLCLNLSPLLIGCVSAVAGVPRLFETCCVRFRCQVQIPHPISTV